MLNRYWCSDVDNFNRLPVYLDSLHSNDQVHLGLDLKEEQVESKTAEIKREKSARDERHKKSE